MIRRLWPLSLGAFALGLDAYILAGLLPRMAADLHTSQAKVGLSIALFTAAYAISAPALSSIASRYSVRTALLCGLGLFSVGNIATMAAPSLWVLLTARMIAGIGAGVFSPLASYSAANLVDASRRGRALSMVLAGLSMGTALGVPLGLLIEDRLGWRWTIGFIVVSGLISAIGVLIHCARFQTPRSIAWHERVMALRTSFTLSTLAVTLWTGIASLGLYTYMAEVTMANGLSLSLNTLIWMWGLGGMTGALLIGRLLDICLPPIKATLILLVALGIGFYLFGFMPLPMVMLGAFLWGLAGWASIAPQQHALVTHSPKHAVALIAWNSSANYLGGAIGAAAGSVALMAHLPAHWLPIGALLAVVIAITVHIGKTLKLEKDAKGFNDVRHY
ncbi:MFS transporter [Sodalis ligni]|uniref:MFS transporter n=1 Tax=Sodalis ligni TaxID=2697027 RepID=UPI00193FBB06|nr:MFS transporter [Sodalis ligni]QWA10391.1 MFS transporter [Sodalis ligni]